jgi:hypothetical protein
MLRTSLQPGKRHRSKCIATSNYISISDDGHYRAKIAVQLL